MDKGRCNLVHSKGQNEKIFPGAHIRGQENEESDQNSCREEVGVVENGEPASFEVKSIEYLGNFRVFVVLLLDCKRNEENLNDKA